MKLPRLGTVGVDNASNQAGTLVSATILVSKPRNDSTTGPGVLTMHQFRAHGLSKETGLPLAPITIVAYRFSPAQYDEVDVPLNLAGKRMVHDNTGFAGTVSGFILHPFDRLHVIIQPTDRLSNGEIVQEMDFDIRECSIEDPIGVYLKATRTES